MAQAPARFTEVRSGGTALTLGLAAAVVLAGTLIGATLRRSARRH